MELKEGVLNAVKAAVATANEAGIFFVNPKSPMIAQAVKAGAVEVNMGIAGETAGQYAARLTEAAKASYFAEVTPTEAPTPKTVENGSSENMDNTETTATPAVATAGNIAGYAVATVSPPASKKRGKWTPIFEGLADGQSVFIPATADMTEPKETLASTITGQNKREKEVALPGSVAKYFKTYAIDDGKDWGHPGVKGAAIFRLDSERPAK